MKSKERRMKSKERRMKSKERRRKKEEEADLGLRPSGPLKIDNKCFNLTRLLSRFVLSLRSAQTAPMTPRRLSKCYAHTPLAW